MVSRNVLIEVSARHIHLSQEHLLALFGDKYELNVAKPISQPKQFAAQECVEVIGEAGKLKVRVIGPVRAETQVELASSDCRRLGLNCALRLSGTLDGTPGCVLEGPKGRVTLRQGVIVAQRHLHVSPSQAGELGIKHGDTISIRTSGERPVTFHNVAVRSQEGKDDMSFMIDTDEANAAGLRGGEFGEIL